MTLGNMRRNGVRTLAAHCGGRYCHHESVLDVSDYADDVPVPAFALRTVCTRCGAIAQRYEKPRSSFNDRPMGIKNSLRYYAERSCVTLKHSIIIKCQWRE